MKYYVAVILALLTCEFAAPPAAGALGMQATAGFDAADVFCMAAGVAVFALSLIGASYF